MSEPPRTIPSNLYDRYTLNGKIPVVDWYIDSTKEHTTNEWTDAYIEEFVKDFSIHNIENNILPFEFYRGAARYHLSAFQKLPEAIQGKHIAVIGSLHPWIEAICLQLKAASVTTVEYNVPKETSYIKTMTYSHFETVSEEFDTLISYSSIEHSGLGRYGDPLCPEADLITMKHCHKALKKGGIFFLGVPIGRDTLFWNAHRIYGPLRLPLLLKGFEDLFWVGALKQKLDTYDPQDHKQPVIAIKKVEMDIDF